MAPDFWLVLWILAARRPVPGLPGCVKAPHHLLSIMGAKVNSFIHKWLGLQRGSSATRLCGWNTLITLWYRQTGKCKACDAAEGILWWDGKKHPKVETRSEIDSRSQQRITFLMKRRRADTTIMSPSVKREVEMDRQLHFPRALRSCHQGARGI